MILTVLSFTESVRVQFSRVYTIPWTVAGQTSLSMDSPGKNTGVGCHFPAPGDLPDPGIKPTSPGSSALAGGLFFFFLPLVPEMARHSSVLGWRIPGTGEPGGLPSVGSRRVGRD